MATYSCALITGASSGIGESLARALPTQTDLVLTGRDSDRLKDLKADLTHADRNVETLAADLTQEAGRQELIKLANHRPIDLLVNNAGLGLLGPFADNPPDREREMVELNCVAPVVITRAFLPGMLERARANGTRAGLILVASTAAFMPLPRLATYSATKAFDLHLAEALAAELADDPIDVLALCPGSTKTRFFERADFAGRVPGPATSPDRVAREALAALGRRSVHVVGGGNRAMVGAASLLPRSLTRRGTRSIMERLKRRSQ